MDYNKLTKAELIELLKGSISIEKYNRLEENLKTKKAALEEQKLIADTYKEQLDFEKQISFNKIREAESNQEVYKQQVQNQFENMKNHIDYTSNMLSKEYQLSEILVNKTKYDNELFEKIVNLYHEALFENKNTQESE
jgi:parvulin-like peptidyl-prolyl isomerase